MASPGCLLLADPAAPRWYGELSQPYWNAGTPGQPSADRARLTEQVAGGHDRNLPETRLRLADEMIGVMRVGTLAVVACLGVLAVSGCSGKQSCAVAEGR